MTDMYYVCHTMMLTVSNVILSISIQYCDKCVAQDSTVVFRYNNAWYIQTLLITVPISVQTNSHHEKYNSEYIDTLFFS